MKLIVICVFYPPLNSSAAIQIKDLVDELSKKGHKISVITPVSKLNTSLEIKKNKLITLYRFKVNKIQDINFFYRTINEFFCSFIIILKIIVNSLKFKKYDGIIWWSPSIFLTPLVFYFKFINRCPTYLILRDLFPRWAWDLNIISNKLLYKFFEFFFKIQFLVADKVGVQSKGNIRFIPKKVFGKKIKVEVLNNWNTPLSSFEKFEIEDINFRNKKVFIYAGNIGLAQGFETVFDLAQKFNNDNKLAFLFIGRGSRFQYFKDLAKKRFLQNVYFYPEIPNSKLIQLYKKCFAGIVVLNRSHKTHNIPGKFISYIHSGLPVFAVVNPNNDLIKIIKQNNIGFATSNYGVSFLTKKINEFVDFVEKDGSIKKRAIALSKSQFNTSLISEQILSNFKRNKN